jgi:hypothetical protein
MPHGITWKAEADHLIDGPPIMSLPGISQPIGKIGTPLPPKPILRRQDKSRIVPGVAENRSQCFRNDKMTTAG